MTFAFSSTSRRVGSWKRFTARWGSLAVLGVAFVSCQNGFPGRSTEQPVDFLTEIRPILENRCLECHNHVDSGESAGLNLETRRTALTTGRHAPVIRPGDPEHSLLYSVLSVPDLHPMFMPPSPDRLWEEDLAKIYRWIEQGASWPEGPEGRLVRPQDWD